MFVCVPSVHVVVTRRGGSVSLRNEATESEWQEVEEVEEEISFSNCRKTAENYELMLS